MKYIISVIFALLFAISSFGQGLVERSVTVIDFFKTENLVLQGEVITTFTVGDSVHVENMANPDAPLDGVNLQTLQDSLEAAVWDSIVFNIDNGYAIWYGEGSKIDSSLWDGRYVEYLDSTIIFVTPTQLSDSLIFYVQYSDSLSVFVTPTQLADSLLNYVQYDDSLTTFVTPTQLADSLTNYVEYDDSLTTFVTPIQLSDSLDAFVLDTVQKIDFWRTEGVQPYREGRLSYNKDSKALEYFDENPLNPPIKVSRDDIVRGFNNTGVTIPKGDVVFIDGIGGAFPSIRRAIADTSGIAERTIGVVANDILNGEDGRVVRFGFIPGFNTTGFDVNDLIYLSATDSGKIVNARPRAPYYSVRLGYVPVIGVSGVLGIETLAFNGSDTEVNIDGALNGIVTQTQEVDIIVEGGVIYVEVRNEEFITEDLPYMIGGFRHLLNTTTSTGTGGRARVALTPGLIDFAQTNYIYIQNIADVPTLVASTTYPYIDKAWIAVISVLDVTSTDNNGALMAQRINNTVDFGDGNGIFNYMAERLRREPAKYFTGIDPTATIITNGGALDNLNVTTTSGAVSQMHLQTYDAQTGVEYYVINYPGEPYKRITDLNEIDVDALGNSLRNNNSRYGLTILGGQNSNLIGASDRLYINLPEQTLGNYGSDLDCINDVDNYAVTNVPLLLSTTAFRLCRICIRYTTGSSGTLINILESEGLGNFQEERGNLLGTAGGGGGSESITDFSDGSFSLFNSTDPTKILNYSLSGLTTATTRTVTAQDQDGIMALQFPSLFTQGSVIFADATGLLTQNTEFTWDNTQGLLTVQNQSGTNTDHVLKINDFAGATKFSVQGFGVVTSGDIRPNADGVNTMGTTALNWAELYLDKTQSSVLFMGSDGQVIEDNSNFNWEDGSNILNISQIIATGTVTGSNLSGSNNGDVTLSGIYDYITLSGQDIIRGQVDYTTDISNLPTIVNNHSGLTELDYASAGHTGFEQALTFSTGLTRSVNTITTNDSEVNHNNLLNYAIEQHRIINDGGVSSTELWSASKIDTELGLKIDDTEKGANNGVATLDGGGKIPFTQLPASLMIYKGIWDASINSPTLADGVGTTGWVYKASPGGTQDLGSGNITFADGDWAIYNGAEWEKSINSDAVLSVNSQTGIVVLDTDDINEGSTNLYYTEARVSANTDVAANTAARHDAVTLSGAYDYITLTGQDIVRNQVDYTTDISNIPSSFPTSSTLDDVLTNGNTSAQSMTIGNLEVNDTITSSGGTTVIGNDLDVGGGILSSVSTWTATPLVKFINTDNNQIDSDVLLLKGGALSDESNVLEMQDFNGATIFNTTGVGNTTLSGNLAVNGTGDSYVMGNWGIGDASPDHDFMIRGTTDQMFRMTRTGARSWSNFINSSGDYIIHDLTAASDRIAIDDGGNVGIGTTSPVTKVEAIGIIASRSGVLDASTEKFRLGRSEDSSNRFHSIYSTSSATQADNRVDFLLHSPGSSFTQLNVLSLIGNGNVGIGTTSPTDKLEIEAPNSQLRLVDSDDSNYAQFSYSGGNLAIRNNSTGANHLFLNTTGNVFIGAPTGTEKFEVTGSIKSIGGDIILTEGFDLAGAGTGTIGQVVTSDGAGVSSWQDLNHSGLNELDYVSAGHTGFEQALTFSTGLTRTTNTITTNDSEINHDGLLNFLTTEHFLQSAITGLTVAQSGTGASSFTSNALLTGNGTSAIQAEAGLTYDGTSLDVDGNIEADSEDPIISALDNSATDKFAAIAVGDGTTKWYMRYGETNTTHGDFSIDKTIADIGTPPFLIDNINGDVFIGNDLVVTNNIECDTIKPSQIYVTDNPILVQGDGNAYWHRNSSGDIRTSIGTVSDDAIINLYNTSDSETITIRSNGQSLFNGGNVAIGNITASTDLDVDGNARFRAIGSGAFSAAVNQTSDGTLTTSTSDSTLKMNFEPLPYTLDEILSIERCLFDWRPDTLISDSIVYEISQRIDSISFMRDSIIVDSLVYTDIKTPIDTIKLVEIRSNKRVLKDIGVKAQDVGDKIPELRFFNKTDSLQGVHYNKIGVLALEAISQMKKIHDAEIDSLSFENAALRTELDYNTYDISQLQQAIIELQYRDSVMNAKIDSLIGQ